MSTLKAQLKVYKGRESDLVTRDTDIVGKLLDLEFTANDVDELKDKLTQALILIG